MKIYNKTVTDWLLEQQQFCLTLERILLLSSNLVNNCIIIHYAIKMIYKNNFQTDSYLFIVLNSVIGLPFAKKTHTQQHRRRLQWSKILDSNTLRSLPVIRFSSITILLSPEIQMYMFSN